MTALYELHGLEKTYQNRTVLKIPALEFIEGHTTSLLGPNGSGKTTLLEILAFISRADSGRMRFRGRDVRFSETGGLAALRREVVLVDQHPILFSKSVYKNVEYGLAVRKIPKAERLGIIEECMDLVGMKSFLSARRHKLSGGETQRLAIARALACSPKVMLFDEPTASVDVENQIAIENIMADIAEEKGITVIFTTHNYTQAARLAKDKVFLLQGSPAKSLHENIFAGVVRDGPGGGAACTLGESLCVPLDTAHRGPAKISLNPRRIKVRHKERAHDGMYSGRITQLAMERDSVRVVVDLGLPVSLLLDSPQFSRKRLTVGDEVEVELLPGCAGLI